MSGTRTGKIGRIHGQSVTTADLARLALSISVAVTGVGAVAGLFWWAVAAFWVGATARTPQDYGALALICLIGIILVGTPFLAVVLARQERHRLAQLACLPALTLWTGVAVMMVGR